MEDTYQTTTSDDVNDHSEPPLDSIDFGDVERQPLTTKNAVEFLLNGTLRNTVCRYCLNVTSQLLELDKVLQIGGKRALYQITIRDMIAHFHPFQASQDSDLPNKICELCLDRTLQAYLFTQQCEQSERALNNCLEDISERVDKLDPLQRKSKRGRQKINPNHNKIYVAYENVMDYAEPITHLVNQGSALVIPERTGKSNDLTCLKCWEVLPNMESLLNHEKIHPKSMWYHCRQCGRSFAKHLHLKKHIKSFHSQEDVPITNNQGFECKTCGDSLENHHKYLQHIEKHKFKKVLKHVLLEKTDELCTICLNKEPMMVDLETRMALSGSCPELNGDKSLYQIIGSTLPDLKQSHKYRELVVSNPAKIIKICRKRAKASKADTILKSEENKEITDEQDTFVFAYPVRMINVTLDIKGENYTFTFSEPATFVNDTANGPTDVKNIAFEKEYEGEKVTEQNELAKNTDLCKTCWVFTTPQCKSCLPNNLDDEIRNNQDSDVVVQNMKVVIKNSEQNPCSYCWLYTKLNKCDFCQKINIHEEEEIKSHASIEPVIEVKTSDDFANNSSTTRKRPLGVINRIETQKKSTKKLIWQCHVCLTINDGNREKCFCCESSEFIHETNKVNLGSQKQWGFDIPEPESKNSEDSETVLIKTAELNIQEKDYNNQPVKFTTEENEKSKDVGEMMDTNTDSNNQELFNVTTNIDHKSIEIMDVNDEENTDQEFMQRTPTAPSITGPFGIKPTYTTQEIKPMIGNAAVAVNSFRFSIGSGNVEHGRHFRRVKRPIKRSTCHK